MKTRILASTMLLPVFICCYFGGYILEAMVILLSFIGVHEFIAAFNSKDFKLSKVIMYGSVLLLYILDYFLRDNTNLTMYWTIIILILSMIYGFNVKERKIEETIGTFFGTIYVVLLFYQLILIDRSLDSIYIWLVFLTAFGTDIMAYFIGFAIGKHKLCPDLSPKKTVEGAIGGVLGSILFNFVFCIIFIKEFPVYIAIFSILGSIVSQFGDLASSAIKRKLEIKDYGKLIPGHGGILDRFDSVLFVAPILYMVMQFI